MRPLLDAVRFRSATELIDRVGIRLVQGRRRDALVLGDGRQGWRSRRPLKTWTGYNGTWNGTWSTDDRAKGTASCLVKLDAEARMLTMTVTLGEGFWGAGTPATTGTQVANMDDYPYVKPPYDVD